MEELTAVFQKIADDISGIRISLAIISMYLALMLFFKDMGNGAKDAIKSLKNKIDKR